MGVLSNLTDEYFGDRVREEYFSRKVALMLKDIYTIIEIVIRKR